MPKGKGTYGSSVGRPPKKKYQVGGVIDDAVLEAAQMEQEFPIANARDRIETYQLGGMVKPPTSPSITPKPSYRKGGKVK